MKLYKRQGGSIWQASVMDGHGRRVRVSTGCTDYDEAMAKARSLLAPALLDRSAEEIDALAAKARRLRKEAGEARSAQVPLREAWAKAEYRGTRGDAKPRTLAHAKEAWDCFVKDALAAGAETVGDLTQKTISDIMASHPPRFAQVMHQYARAVCMRLGCPADLWPPKPRHAPSETTHREPLTREQIAMLLAEADAGATRHQSREDGAEFARLVRWMLYTGLRMGDCATLRTADIDAEAMTVSRTMAKTSRRVEFPLHPDLHGDVRTALADGREMLFPSLSSKYMHSPGVLTTRFRRLFARAGITGEPGQFCAHALRTTFASICAEAGVPLAVIQSWLGHTSPMVTRIYARVEDMRAKREAMSKFPRLG